MEISEFKGLIQELPDKLHAFHIKRENWNVEGHNDYIDEIFNKRGNVKEIWLNRGDLFMSRDNLKEYIFLVLMWGYPTKGRGRNIDALLRNENLEALINSLERYEEEDVSIKDLKEDLKIPGIGLSTLTKFTQFLDTTIGGYRAMILDRQIIETIRVNKFEAFSSLKGIRYENALKYYPDYIRIIDQLALDLDTSHDQIEMFLFMFGRNLRDTRVNKTPSTLSNKELILDISGEGEGISYYRVKIENLTLYFSKSSSVFEAEDSYQRVSPFYHSFGQLWSNQEIDIAGVLGGSESSFIHDCIKNDLKGFCLDAISRKHIDQKLVRQTWLELMYS